MVTEAFTSLAKLPVERLPRMSRADFRFAPPNVLLLVALMLAGLGLHIVLYGTSVAAEIVTGKCGYHLPIYRDQD